jgi:hypothetical protein
MSPRKLIFFEFNEVPFRVIDEYCKRHPDSFFAKHIAKLYQYETHAESCRPLEPCFNWPSIHRGVDDKMHGIYDWNIDLQDVDTEFPPVWKILAGDGVNIGLFGSLHSYGSYPSEEELQNTYSFYIPDIFSPDHKSYPPWCSDFQKFCLAMIRRSARNVSTNIDLRACSSLMSHAAELGFQSRTFVDIGFQLLRERFTPWIKTRRRTYHASLAFEVYVKLLRETKPAFATFFTNDLAAVMHRYWAAAFPKDYSRYDVTEVWRKTYQNEIDWAMTKFDRNYERLVKFVDQHPEYKLILVSGIGQAATTAKHLYTEVYITDLARFMRKMGVEPDGWAFVPAMFGRFNVRLSEGYVETFRKSLNTLRIKGEPVRYAEYKNGLFAMVLGHEDLDHSYAFLGDQKIDFHELGLFNVINEDQAGRTGYHVPDGSLMIYDPQIVPKPNQQMRRRISTLDISPSLLQAFGVKAPKYMQSGRIEGIV